MSRRWLVIAGLAGAVVAPLAIVLAPTRNHEEDSKPGLATKTRNPEEDSKPGLATKTRNHEKETTKGTKTVDRPHLSMVS